MMSPPGSAGAQSLSAITDDGIPVFRVAVWADTITDFTNRVSAYSELRSQLESRLPPVTTTDDVRQMRRERRSLAQAIRSARRGATQGEFFTATTSAQFQLVLAGIMDAQVWAAIMDETPGAFGQVIDGSYPEGKTLSTMPGLVLARLPELPNDIQYRFVGRDLILYDVRANTIIDRMPDAIRCANCD